MTFFFWVNWDIVLALPFFNKSETERFLDDMFYKFKFVKFLYKRLIILYKKNKKFKYIIVKLFPILPNNYTAENKKNKKQLYN